MFLEQRGLVRNAMFTLCAWDAIARVNKAWAACLQKQMPDLKVKPSQCLLGFLHGSFLLGKAYCDIDVSLISSADPLLSLEALAKELQGCGSIYIGKSQRCPRMAIKVQPSADLQLLPLPLPAIEVDITMLSVEEAVLKRVVSSPVVDTTSLRAATVAWKAQQVPFLVSELGRERGSPLPTTPLPCLDVAAVTSQGMLSADAVGTLQAPSLTKATLRRLGLEEPSTGQSSLFEDASVLFSMGQWLDLLHILLQTNRIGGALFHGPRKFDILEAGAAMIERAAKRLRRGINEGRVPLYQKEDLSGAPLAAVASSISAMTRPSFFVREFLRGLSALTTENWNSRFGRRVPPEFTPRFVSMWSSLLETAREMVHSQEGAAPGCLAAQSAEELVKVCCSFMLPLQNSSIPLFCTMFALSLQAPILYRGIRLSCFGSMVKLLSGMYSNLFPL